MNAEKLIKYGENKKKLNPKLFSKKSKINFGEPSRLKKVFRAIFQLRL